MAVPFKLVQQILRSATEDEGYELISTGSDAGDIKQVYYTLRQLQTDLRAICEQGRVLTESEVAGSRFRYALSGGTTGPQEWLIAVERAIQITENCTSLAGIRAYLRSGRRTHTDFQLLQH